MRLVMTITVEAATDSELLLDRLTRAMAIIWPGLDLNSSSTIVQAVLSTILRFATSASHWAPTVLLGGSHLRLRRLQLLQIMLTKAFTLSMYPSGSVRML